MSKILRPSNFYNAVVGSAAQVARQEASHTTLQAAHDAVSAGDRIFVLNRSHVGDTTLTKEVYIEGQGRGANLAGLLVFAPGSDFSRAVDLRFNDDVTIDSPGTGIIITNCYIIAGKSINDNGSGNSLFPVIQE